jgi:hypothetical protein
MNTITLIVGIILAGPAPGSTNMNSNMATYQDIKSCTAAAQKVLEDNTHKPNVISVSASCTVLNADNALKSVLR